MSDGVDSGGHGPPRGQQGGRGGGPPQRGGQGGNPQDGGFGGQQGGSGFVAQQQDFSSWRNPLAGMAPPQDAAYYYGGSSYSPFSAAGDSIAAIWSKPSPSGGEAVPFSGGYGQFPPDSSAAPGQFAANSSPAAGQFAANLTAGHFAAAASDLSMFGAGGGDYAAAYGQQQYGYSNSQYTQWGDNSSGGGGGGGNSGGRNGAPYSYLGGGGGGGSNVQGEDLRSGHRGGGVSDVSQGMDNLKLGGGKKSESNGAPAAGGPKKVMSWANVASQPAKPTPQVTKTKKPGVLPPPAIIPSSKPAMSASSQQAPPQEASPPLMPPQQPQQPPPMPMKEPNFGPQPVGHPQQHQGGPPHHHPPMHQQGPPMTSERPSASQYMGGNHGVPPPPLNNDRHPRDNRHDDNRGPKGYGGGGGNNGPMNPQGPRANRVNGSGMAGGYPGDRGGGPGMRGPPPSSIMTGNGGGGGGVDKANPVLDTLKSSNEYNPRSFDLNPKNARYFVIKSFSEDDIHRSIKYEIWCSTDHGNKRLDAAYKERQGKGPIFLLFSVNGSGHFCGMAEMLSCLDYTSASSVWVQDKFKGQFKVKWIYVKDVPNGQLRHIRLENNENKPVTNSRDTQEVPPEKGKMVLKIIHGYKHQTSIFDDFTHYEKRQEEEDSKKQSGGGIPGLNSDHGGGGGGGHREHHHGPRGGGDRRPDHKRRGGDHHHNNNAARH